MLMALKSHNEMQQTASMNQNNLSILYCSSIRYLLSNILLFSVNLSLDHELPKYIYARVLYTMIF